MFSGLVLPHHLSPAFPAYNSHPRPPLQIELKCPLTVNNFMNVGNRLQNTAEGPLKSSGPQCFWHQGLVSGKTIFPQTGMKVMVWG